MTTLSSMLAWKIQLNWVTEPIRKGTRIDFVLLNCWPDKGDNIAPAKIMNANKSQTIIKNHIKETREAPSTIKAPNRSLPTLWLSGQFSSIAQSYPTLWDPMDCSTPGFLVHHQLLEATQTHVHRVSDAIQSSHPLLSPSPPTFNLSQHQGLFQWVSFLHQVV